MVDNEAFPPLVAPVLPSFSRERMKLLGSDPVDSEIDVEECGVNAQKSMT